MIALNYRQAPLKPLEEAILDLMREYRVLPGAFTEAADEAFDMLVAEKMCEAFGGVSGRSEGGKRPAHLLGDEAALGDAQETDE